MEEMKNDYTIEPGSCDIIIKHISDKATKMEKKMMFYKILRKCRKEEVPT
jgi:hypothetical protein